MYAISSFLNWIQYARDCIQFLPHFWMDFVFTHNRSQQIQIPFACTFSDTVQKRYQEFFACLYACKGDMVFKPIGSLGHLPLKCFINYKLHQWEVIDEPRNTLRVQEIIFNFIASPSQHL